MTGHLLQHVRHKMTGSVAGHDALGSRVNRFADWYHPPIALMLVAALLSGCVTPPMGPTALIMPAQNKPFQVFVQDDSMCKQFAGGQVDGGAAMANLKQFGTAAITTALGAGLGASVRGRHGAEFGGAVGALGGSAMAARGSARDQTSLQGRYDLAYTQCMYSRGNQVATAAPPAPRFAGRADAPGPHRAARDAFAGDTDPQGPSTIR